ncbi:MAG: PD-(D/E)XK nuclease family protein [Myxococcota bacterium]
MCRARGHARRLPPSRRALPAQLLRHYPFDDGETLGSERRVVFLDEDGRYKMQGIIDRISRARDGVIEVHDYKTGARVLRSPCSTRIVSSPSIRSASHASTATRPSTGLALRRQEPHLYVDAGPRSSSACATRRSNG